MSSRLWILRIAKGFRFYEQLRVMDDTKNSKSRELRPLDDMNKSGLWWTSMTPGCEIRALDAMNNVGLWIT